MAATSPARRRARAGEHDLTGPTHEQPRDFLRRVEVGQQFPDRLLRLQVHADVVVLSGGVSMGKADYVPQVLGKLGVDVVFHKISQRPGKPMWFGMGPQGQAVFALPGNPVSTLVCARQYVLPALARSAGEPDPLPEFAALAQDVSFNPSLTCFLPARLVSGTGGQVLAMPVATNTIHDMFRSSAEKSSPIVEL